jgi:hypothetical protein
MGRQLACGVCPKGEGCCREAATDDFGRLGSCPSYRMSSPKCHVSVEVFLPVCGNAAGRSRCRLPARVMRGLRQRRAFVELLSPVVPEPVLPRLEALDDRVPSTPRMV